MRCIVWLRLCVDGFGQAASLIGVMVHSCASDEADLRVLAGAINGRDSPLRTDQSVRHGVFAVVLALRVRIVFGLVRLSVSD